MAPAPDVQLSRRLLLGSALVVLLLVAVVAAWQVAVAGPLVASSVALLSGPGYLAAFPLLFSEEAGLPLPLPGDVFVMFVGHRLAQHPRELVAAWLGFVLCVTLGSSVLYWISRRLGRRVLTGRLAGVLHLTPTRLEWAERWFARWGLIAVIFGRHVPTGRIPITVAAGVLKMHYAHFAFGVMVSAAVWAAFFLAVGAVFGGQLTRLLQLHQELAYLVVPVALAGIVAFVAYRLLVRPRLRRRRAKAGAYP